MGFSPNFIDYRLSFAIAVVRLAIGPDFCPSLLLWSYRLEPIS
ncbi:hypothetical protein [Pasteuria penetrans]|nr:hypothetical protein [Pasteuria penetrans]